MALGWCEVCAGKEVRRFEEAFAAAISAAAPESLVRECLHDADGEARELAEAWI
jgi:hypothetical protein